jgi:hypothetical protein
MSHIFHLITVFRFHQLPILSIYELHQSKYIFFQGFVYSYQLGFNSFLVYLNQAILLSPLQ